ncbi:hypothetical protein D9756_002876 [Leucocoprinus leucothites]|uniref:Uncharacterized protein n=1 Tax=Leucocoprinus leucothites TaxID=201217 RepID=A0A8H5LJC5_9AGAR|nr:hypothetical protein D9756_002876 [Leucoagaricus leucothites]
MKNRDDGVRPAASRIFNNSYKIVSGSGNAVTIPAFPDIQRNVTFKNSFNIAGNRNISAGSNAAITGSSEFRQSFVIRGDDNRLAPPDVWNNEGVVQYDYSHNVTGSRNRMIPSSVNQNKGEVTYVDSFNIEGADSSVDGRHVDHGRRSRGLLQFFRSWNIRGNQRSLSPPAISKNEKYLVVQG